MTAGHILSHSAPARKVKADLNRKHRKWPLGTVVMVKTPEGYLRGRVFKHWRIDENEHGASVEFPDIVDMGDANGERYCHEIPFRSMKPVRQGVVLDEKLFKRLSRLKESNLHGEGYQAAAQALGLPKLAEQFDRINSQRARLGHLPWDLLAERHKAYENLLAEAKVLVTATQYDKLYMCF